MESASNFLANNVLTLGILIILGLVIAVVYAALKHALVRQLESKISQLNNVLQENTQNIAQKQKLLEAKTEAHDELKTSLQDLSARHQDLRHEFNDTAQKLSKVSSNYEQVQKDYLTSVQTIADNQREYELDKQSRQNQFDKQLLEVRQEAENKIDNFQENYRAEFEHLKKSHKRLVQANQTMSKNVDNLRSERDFYRTEFQTLRNFLHDSQVGKAKKLVEEHDINFEKNKKVVKLSNKDS
ncbi:hypothetical protein [Kangiella sp. TOML190]|uniref:hypothetical protein n=1 Tax=Kangiella sp. TOML190 TaxID=2931351 RepID=UPI00203E162F|nr:hypothetical protein [Kangiella sp. TOML190]